ncbi:hypothetical protein MIR68_002665 [Amoeboaphelidium protococcarum]|nr:hypothetical protein MIR68_002665 [Amoeboaphelidium protococcarum]
MTTISKQAKKSVLFFGSCDFSVTSLKALLRYRQRTDSVIDRIEVVTPSRQHASIDQSLAPQVPLERFALAHQLTLHQPITDRVDHRAIDVNFGQQKFDFGVVVSFGHKLSADLIQRFRLGTLNVHPSLLPKYRGAAPLQYQILNGDKVGGVSIISLHPYQFDVGKVYKQTRVEMPQYISYGDLHRQFAAIGASDLVSVTHNFSQYSKRAQSQDSINLGDDSNRTAKAPKIKSSLAFVDPLKMSAASIYRRHLAIGHQFTIHTKLFYSDVYVNEILSPEESDKQLSFAPLNVPFHRRIETLSVAITASLFFINLAVTIFCLLTPVTYPVLIAYAIYVYFDSAPEHGGRRLDWVRKSKFWLQMRNYFPCRLVKEADLDPERNYIFGYHPHGIIATGLWINFCTEANNVSKVFPGIKIHALTLNANFRFPIWREFLLASGICSVSRKSCDYILKKAKGNSIILVPGGAREALDAHPGTIDLTLNKRRGFIKVALSNGCDLVPVLSFGENDIFNQVANSDGTVLRKWQQWFLKYVSIAPCIPYGRGFFQYDFGFLPRRRPIITVVGKPISVPKTENPSPELIAEYHGKYVDALQEIFDKYKDEYAPDRVRDLRIIR